MDNRDYKKLLPRAVKDLAATSYAGVLIYVILFVSIIYATGYEGRHPTLTVWCVAGISLVSLARLFLAMSADRISSTTWVRWFSVLTVLIVSVWSGFWTYVIYLDGLNQTTLLSIAASVGIASAGVGTLSPIRNLSIAVIIIMFWPSGLVLSTQRNAVLLEERASQLADATRAKSDFLARMSHEIRTPLNGILGMAQMLQRSRLDQTQGKYVDLINKSGDALLSIINDILDLSRIEAGRLDLRSEPFDLVETVNATMDMLEPEATAKDLVLRRDIAADVPRWLVGDAGRIRQILTNLIGNAIKFTDTGSVTVQLSADRTDRTHADIGVVVIDTGIGIPEEARERIFESFSQEPHVADQQLRGTGLGLAISQQLIEMMSGTIAVSSNEGQGAVFSLNLPMELATREAVEAAKRASMSAGAPSPGSLSGAVILVAEDNPVNQLFLSETLKTLGCAVETVDDGLQAIEACMEGHFAAILMDMQMPNLGGLDAARAIRAAEGRQDHTPIIAVTANAHKGERESCMAAGLDDYISKPFHIHELQTVLERWVKPTVSADKRNHLH